ncbi:molybdenum ABC transporter ATP-binding protein [Kushneria marisflavi]|uniref:Molybdenum ABC transporter ATP-binding protein n=1 Tax=Kushneria marisflavi TaxID=157779 RepID=A0A240UMJ3_9GAMM|nr:molybdenum ABC transporter ATP-binding protein [Kushneria marisflavi]ART62346.1 molybdenum ABC transporter ATP-binding protein [Kushneria marisflavi]RKD87454.1 molybdate transport system ATP-binding protein [Kushneria marisflavi]
MLELCIQHRQGSFNVDVDITIPGSGVTALFGHSGSGKTTLLRMLAGLDRPDQGRVVLNERTFVDTERGIFIPPHQRRLGVVFQEARLFPHYRVRSNLTYARRITRGAAFDRIVSLLGIEALLDRMPGALSGGEARRVAIGRALLAEPDMLLMDEPLTGLDGARKQELLDYILRLTREIDLPILFVSHDPEELMAVAEQLVVMDQGQIVASDALEHLLSRGDMTPWLGGFEASSLLQAQVHSHDHHYHATRLTLGDRQRLTLPLLDRLEGSMLRVRVRRREVAIALSPQRDSSVRNQLEAIVSAITPGAPGTLEVTLSLGDQSLSSRITLEAGEALGLKPGMTVIALIRSVSLAG